MYFYENTSDKCDSENVCDKLNNNDDNYFGISESDKGDAQCVHNYYLNTCGCNRINGKPCSSVVDRKVLNDYKDKKTELDILNMLKKVQLLHLRNNSSENLLRNTGQRERERQDYQ